MLCTAALELSGDVKEQTLTAREIEGYKIWTPPKKREEADNWAIVEEEMMLAGKDWNDLSGLAQDRAGWRFAGALCYSRSEED